MRSPLSFRLALLVSVFIFACSKKAPDDLGGMTAPSASASAASSASAAPADSASAAASAEPASSASAIVSGASKRAAPSASASAGAANCGAKTNPCPLQKWMNEHTQSDLAAGDNAALVSDFDKVATFAPVGYSKWASIAKDGATAARAQNTDAAKAACRTCHDQYKSKYKSEMRTRAVP